MGYFASLVATETKLSVYDRWLELMDIGHKSKAGPSVSLTNAFRVSAALACLRVLGYGAGQVPFKLMQDTESDGLPRKVAAKDHPLYDLTATKPNDWQTSFEFREQLMWHAAMGNAYVYKNPYKDTIGEMFLLDPARVTAEQLPDWSTVYKVQGKDGQTATIDSKLIWHVRGPSWDGFLGLDILNLAREALGLSIALEESHARLHANSVRSIGTYSIDGTLSPAQQDQVTKWLKKQVTGENAGSPLIIDRGAKWLQTSMSGVDAQHKETRDQQVEEVCRFFGVMPIMVGFSDKTSTYASAESMFQAHVVNTLAPWYRRIETSADCNLLTEAERKAGYYFNFNANGLLRGSMKDRGEYFSKALGAGGSPAWMTQDQVRMLEDMDPMGGTAAALPVPTNVGTPGAPA